jgi:hypothetical protein
MKGMVSRAAQGARLGAKCCGLFGVKDNQEKKRKEKISTELKYPIYHLKRIKP